MVDRRPPAWSWRGGWPRSAGGGCRALLWLLVLGVGSWLWLWSSRAPERCTDDTTARAAVRVSPPTEALRAELLLRADDVWSERSDGPSVDVVLDGPGRAWLRAQSVSFEVLVADIDAEADAERERLAVAEVARPEPEQWFREYRDFETIIGYLDTLAELRPDIASVETIGQSLEGRPLRALRIRGAGPRTTGLLLDGGLHAREWIAMAVSTCVADRLVRGYDHDPRIRALVDRSEVVIVPVANPDGYVHSWTRDRYWRKNRRGTHGVDLNRNFGYAWGGKGSSDKPASQVYRGAEPFSEPESQALRELMLREDFAAHIDFHSYGQLLLHPWAYTKKRSKDHKRLESLAKGMVGAIGEQHGKRYRLMSGQSLYPAAGTLMDWAYGERGAMSFVIELRPKGGGGFVLPPEQIVPTCDEGLAAVLSLGDALAR